MEGRITTDYLISFLLGGKCQCIIVDNIHKRKDEYILKESKGLYFVYCKMNDEFIYGGYIREAEGYKYTKGVKGNIECTDLKIQNLLYALNYPKCLPKEIEIWHIGRCARCGRKLTNPISIDRGMGPECMTKV